MKVVAAALGIFLFGELAAAGEVPANRWVKLEGAHLGRRFGPALVYDSAGKRFLVLGGGIEWRTYNRQENPYDDLALDLTSGRWENLFPPGKEWGPRFGNATPTRFKSERFALVDSEGNVRPNVSTYRGVYYYNQYAYDSDRGRVYFFARGHTFSYDPAARAWKDLAPATDPAGGKGKPPLLWGAMCYDPVNKKVLLFGGGNVETQRGDPGTWTYDPDSNVWARLSSAAANGASGLQPPQRALSKMVYDPSSKQIVLFGGDQLDRLLADTWVFDCASKKWLRKRPAVSPAPRAGHALVYLPTARKILLAGGFTYTSTTDYCGAQYRNLPFEMWTYDTAKNEWSLLKRAEDAKSVPGRNRGGTAFPAAASADDLVVALHHTSVFRQPETWTCRVDASTSDRAGAAKYGVKPGATTERTGPYVPAFYDEAPAADPKAAEARLKALPANTWVRLTPPRRPTVDRCWGTAVLDTDHDVILHWSGGHSSHCGTEVVRYHPGLDRWSLATASEQPLEFVYSNDGTPGQWSFKRRPWMTGHTYKSYGYDPVLKKMLFAGKGDRTYVFDPVGGDWESPTLVNPFRGNMYTTTLCATPKGAVAWTVNRDRVTGGLWRMNAERLAWERLPLKGVLPRMSPDRHGMAYDSKRDRLLFFSNVDKKAAGDVTAYDFKTGVARVLGAAGKQHAAVPSRETIYVPEADMGLLGARTIGPNGRPLWLVYHCEKNAWLGAELAGTDPIGAYRGKPSRFNNSLGLMYDPKRQLIWALGQHSEVTVLRLDLQSARLVELSGLSK